MMRFNVGGRFLELPANFNLQLKKRNILYAFDNIELERTTTFSVPASDINMAIFGWSNDFHRYGEQARKRIAAQLQLDGVTKDGYLYITKYTPQAFECVFVTGELLGLADVKALGDWSQFILPANGIALDADVRIASSGNDYSFARVDYKTDGYIMPSFKLASFAEMALQQSGVMIDWGGVLDKISSHRIVIGKAKGVTETSCTFTRGYLAEQTTETPYPVLNSVLMDDAGELVGVITNEQSEYPIFKVKTADAMQYYGYVQQWIARQDLTLYFADDTPDTLFLASAQMNGTFAFLGGYEFAADGTITGEPLKGREIELQTGQTFLLISQNDYLSPGVGEFEGWTIANETLTANVVIKGADEQPNNAYIRVKDNVPEMTIVELLKTCAALSGTILSYRAGEVVFVEDIAGGAFRELDKPLKWDSLTRGVADYAQRNTIAFESAESVLSSEKIVATYAIDNVNIAEAKELFVLPFSEGQDSAGMLYIGSAFDGYTIGTWNAEKSNIYLTRVGLPLNASLQSVLEQGTSIVAEVKMTEQKFDTLKNDMVLFFENAAWVWTDGIWSNGVARLSLSKVSVESVKPLPPRIPLDYQEVQYVGTGNNQVSAENPTSAVPLQYGRTETIINNLSVSYANGVFMSFGNTISGLLYYQFYLNRWRDGASIPIYSFRGNIGSVSIGDAERLKIETIMTPSTIANKIDFELKITNADNNLELFSHNVETDKVKIGELFVVIDRIRHCKIYSIKFFNENNELYIDLVPCYRKADMQECLYDAINNVAYVLPVGNTPSIGDDVAPPDRPWE